MSPTKKSIFIFFKWTIIIVAYLFLAYKLITFNQYEELVGQWSQIPISQFIWLVWVLVLLPLNWVLESIKWKLLVAHVQKITLISSYKAVLAGISTGFFTPNRVGDLVGRLYFLDAKNRKAGVTLSLVNSLTQNLIMMLIGIPASIAFFTRNGESLNLETTHLLMILFSCLLFFGLLYFALPILSKHLTGSQLSIKILSFTACLSEYTSIDLLKIIFVSLIRFVIFCTQLYLMLRFFGVKLDMLHAFIAIPACYLFITFTPSIAFSDAVVRSSYAVLFIGAYSPQVIGIAMAGVCIWVINFVIPMLVGSVMLVKKKA